MAALLEKLRQDHVNLDRVLVIMEGQMQRFRSGQALNLDVMVEVLAYVEMYADQVHHPSEYLLYEILIHRLGRSTPALSRIIEEHQSLDGLTRRFRQMLEGILQGQVIPRKEVELLGDEFVQTNRQHLLSEEREIFPMSEDALTNEDWRILEEQVPMGHDPLFGRSDPLHFQSLCEQLSLVDRSGTAR
ncbi:MAG: hemerythrin domain-containing protein [Pseudomonadota bacterium]